MRAFLALVHTAEALVVDFAAVSVAEEASEVGFAGASVEASVAALLAETSPVKTCTPTTLALTKPVQELAVTVATVMPLEVPTQASTLSPVSRSWSEMYVIFPSFVRDLR